MLGAGTGVRIALALSRRSASPLRVVVPASHVHQRPSSESARSGGKRARGRLRRALSQRTNTSTHASQRRDFRIAPRKQACAALSWRDRESSIAGAVKHQPGLSLLSHSVRLQDDRAAPQLREPSGEMIAEAYYEGKRSKQQAGSQRAAVSVSGRDYV